MVSVAVEGVVEVGIIAVPDSTGADEHGHRIMYQHVRLPDVFKHKPVITELDAEVIIRLIETRHCITRMNCENVSKATCNYRVRRLISWTVNVLNRKEEKIEMNLDSESFRVREDEKVSLSKRPTRVEPVYRSKKEYQALLQDHVALLSKLQNIHYASDRYAVLLIFQAMDAAGKDGTIRHVMSGVNPQGCQVFSFKQPSAEELQHDFLWRTTRHLPERGRIGIFNRSFYEEVLIVRVHPELLQAEGFSEEAAGDKKFWKSRYKSIVQFENHLHRNGTRIVKFYLHLSKDEQRRRFLQRIDDPEKNWKFSDADVRERKYWDKYMEAYEECISATSTGNAPWYIVPADDKENARIIVSQIVVDTLKALKLSYPKTPASRKKELESMRVLLQKDLK